MTNPWLKRSLLLILIVFSAAIQISRSQNMITVDLSANIGIGGPLMFGGNNYGFTTQAMSDAHKKAGFNIARYDALINEIVPNTTIADYKNNLNSIQDGSKWNWGRLDHDLGMLNISGFKVLLIINYCPLWLTNALQRQNNNINSMPEDMAVYEDIVKKVFAHVQAKVYAIEVWNEPDTGLKIEGSAYSSRLAAYLDLYYHTAKAIKSVDKQIAIGGPAVADTYDVTFFKALLADERIKNDLNFYSYHFYGVQKTGNIAALKKIAADNGHSGLPIYISEWNYSANFDKNPMNTDANEAISFVGNTLIDQFKEGPAVSILYCMDDLAKADNFYTMYQNGALVPKVKVIQLMSVSLGLGNGASNICKSVCAGDLNSIAAINNTGEPVICIVNTDKSNNVTTQLVIKKDKAQGVKNAVIYLADTEHDPLSVHKVVKLLFKNGKATLQGLLVPHKAVLGIKIV